MIAIHRSTYDSKLNHFYGRDNVKRDEVKLVTRNIAGSTYTHAEPSEKGRWAFGGTILYTSNGVFPEFNTPIKLHDRNMDLEKYFYKITKN